MRYVLSSLLVPVLAMALIACGSSDDSAPTASQGVSEQEATQQADVVLPTDVVSLDQAEQIALDAIGEGRVTWSGPEENRGAAWEIEITQPDGREVDVLIAPDGTMIE